MSWATSWATSSLWLLRRTLRRLPVLRLCAVIGACAAMAAVSAAAAGPGDIGVVVTNASYRDDGYPKVKYADRDGDAVETAMHEVLHVDQVYRYRDQTKTNLDVLFGTVNQPEKGEVWRLVQGANNRTARLIVYYSGHGVPPYPTRDGSMAEAGLLSYDAVSRVPEAGVYPLQTLRDQLTAIKQQLLPEGDVILILESCFSGRSGDGALLRPGTSAVSMTADFGVPAQIIEIDAARGHEAAYWDDNSRHGAFTHQLLWGLYGRADSREYGGDGDGKVTLRELEDFVKKGLHDKGGRQTASFSRHDDTVLASRAEDKWPQRPDMAGEATYDRISCEKMRHEKNYSTRDQRIDAIKKYDETCAWCGCQAEARGLRTELEARQHDDGKQRICDTVRALLNTSADPGTLEAAATVNDCPDLQEALLNKTWSILRGAADAERLRQFAAAVPRGTLRRQVEDRIQALERPPAPQPHPAPPPAHRPPPSAAADAGRRQDAIAMVRRVQDRIARDRGTDATYAAINRGASEFRNGDLYPFIIDFTGMEPANGGRTPRIIGQNVINLRDQNGRFIVRGLIATARNQGKGWYDYPWPNPQTNTLEYKSTYVERIEGHSALVGVGVYRNTQPPGDSTIGVISASLDGTYLQVANDLAKALNDDKLRILPIVGTGGARNIIDVRYVKGIPVGLTQTGILNSFRSNNELMGIDNKIVYIAKLYNEEVHLVARDDITSIEQLQGRKVNIDAEGSGTSYSMRAIFRTLNIEVEEVSMSQTEALQKIRSGEIAATVLIAGKPARAMSVPTAADGLHFVPIPSEPLSADYVPASLTHEDYPGLVPAGRRVDTVADSAVLITFNWSKTNERHASVEKFVDALFARIEEFKQPPYHPKWREVNIYAELPGWTRFEAAQNWLARHPLTDEQPRPANEGGQPSSHASRRR